VTIDIGDGALVLNGTAMPRRSGTFGESAVLRVLAGAGGMATKVTPRWYRKVPASRVVQDVLGDAGETLSATADQGLLARQLSAHALVGTWSSSDALKDLCERLGAVWRVLPDGTVWIGVETWPVGAELGELLSEDPKAQTAEYGPETPTALPATVVGGRKVGTVEHHVSAEKTRTVLHLETNAGDADDRHLRAFKALVDHATARFAFLGRFAARVVQQGSDGTLDLAMDDRDMPGLTKIPIRFGLPGVTAKVAAGSRCRVEFVGGDSSDPEVVSFEAGTPLELELDASTTLKLDAGTGAVTVAGGTVNVEGATAINLGGAAATLAVALMGDTAGPYPVTCKGTLIKGKVA
jgi:hypothetical protein